MAYSELISILPIAFWTCPLSFQNLPDWFNPPGSRGLHSLTWKLFKVRTWPWSVLRRAGQFLSWAGRDMAVFFQETGPQPSGVRSYNIKTDFLSLKKNNYLLLPLHFSISLKKLFLLVLLSKRALYDDFSLTHPLRLALLTVLQSFCPDGMHDTELLTMPSMSFLFNRCQHLFLG